MLSFLAVAGIASSQTFSSVYNRDTHDQFEMKSSSAKARILGPLYRLDSEWVFANPYKKLTEASINFSLEESATLAGFGYWYKREYVPGVLMDKNLAWFIYTAITSRNRDPGIMEQVDSRTYHAQVYPLAIGYDFRLALNSVGLLPADVKGAYIPTPVHPAKNGKPKLEVDSYETSRIFQDGDKWRVKALENPKEIDMHAQRFKDGRYYVVGSLGADGKIVKGLEGVLYARVGDKGRYFSGYRRGLGTVTVTTPTGPRTRRLHGNDRGTDTAKVWANMKLVQQPPKTRKALVKFSLKYGIPSQATALLAVPQEEMKLFREKAAEFRRLEREKARKQREWEANRQQNWQNSGGGDPEIRVHYPTAKTVYAILPDGRSFDLTRGSNGYWGGSFDIPADAAEGEFKVRVFARMEDGTTAEQTVITTVDRTAPEGKALVEDGKIVVRSEPGLARVIAVLADGRELEMKEEEAGVYRLALGSSIKIVKILLMDKAHNRTILPWLQ